MLAAYDQIDGPVEKAGEQIDSAVGYIEYAAKDSSDDIGDAAMTLQTMQRMQSTNN